MKGLRVVVMGVFAIGISASTAFAQLAGPSRGDLRAYAGVGWSSPWLETGDGTRFGIGSNPIVGGIGNYWFTPRLGARLHLAYMPSDLPEPSPAIDVAIPDQRLHNWFYDLSLAVRPFASPTRADRLSSFYVFAGGGAFTANPEGGDPEDCVPTYVQGGACLSYDWRNSTVGQATGGAGITLLPLTRRLGLFTEAAIHFHSSPFHLGEHWTGSPACPNPACRAEDRWVVTTRLVGGLAVGLGLPAAMVPPLLPPPPPTAPPSPPEERPIMICVVLDGMPQYREVFVRPDVGDTVVVTAQEIRRPLRAVHPTPPPTASGMTWFVRDEPLFIGGREYVRFGVPRELEIERFARIGEYQGVPIYAQPGADPAAPPGTVFVPVQDGCVFQPFQRQERVRRVRG